MLWHTDTIAWKIALVLVLAGWTALVLVRKARRLVSLRRTGDAPV